MAGAGLWRRRSGREGLGRVWLSRLFIDDDDATRLILCAKPLLKDVVARSGIIAAAIEFTAIRREALLLPAQIIIAHAIPRSPIYGLPSEPLILDNFSLYSAMKACRISVPCRRASISPGAGRRALLPGLPKPPSITIAVNSMIFSAWRSRRR